MTRAISRIVLSSLALVLLFAGSVNLKLTRAEEEFEVVPAESDCQRYAGCPGGPTTCGTIIEQDGTIVKCGMK